MFAGLSTKYFTLTEILISGRCRPHASGLSGRAGAHGLLDPQCFHVAVAKNVIKPFPVRFVEQRALIDAGRTVRVLNRVIVIDLIQLVRAEGLRPKADAGPDIAGALLAAGILAKQYRSRRVFNGSDRKSRSVPIRSARGRLP